METSWDTSAVTELSWSIWSFIIQPESEREMTVFLITMQLISFRIQGAHFKAARR